MGRVSFGGLPLVFAGLATALICFPVWPGLLSFDSLFAYQQARDGISTALWPPLHAYLLHLSLALSGGIGLLLAAQAFVLFWSAGVIFNRLAPDRAAVMCGVFFLLCLWFPTLAGTLVVHWRDGLVGSFLFAGLALWLSGRPALAIMALSIAAGLRSNAVVLVLPIMLAAIWSAPHKRRLAGLMIVGLTLAWASNVWRLPDLQRLPSPNPISSTQEWDLIGISACSGKVYLPPAATGGIAITPTVLSRAYDPRHFLLTLGRKPDVPLIYWLDADPSVPLMWRPEPQAPVTHLGPLWRHAIAEQPLCYLKHRALVLGRLLGVQGDGVVLPTLEEVDLAIQPVPPARPKLALATLFGVRIWANVPVARVFWLLSFGGLAGAVLCYRRRMVWLLAPLAIGAALYLTSFAVLAPGADARYTFPINALAALVLSLSLSLTSSAKRTSSCIASPVGLPRRHRKCSSPR